MRTCQKCGSDYAKPPHMTNKQYGESKFCGRSCSNSVNAAVQQRARREYVIGEVEWLIGTDCPDSIAHRLGYRDGDVLVRMLEKWDRLDLAASMRRTVVAA